MSDCCFVSLSVILILAPAVLAQPGALELVSVSQSVSESVRSKFFRCVSTSRFHKFCLSVCLCVPHSDSESYPLWNDQDWSGMIKTGQDWSGMIRTGQE